jgi:hypothetical protein
MERRVKPRKQTCLRIESTLQENACGMAINALSKASGVGYYAVNVILEGLMNKGKVIALQTSGGMCYWHVKVFKKLIKEVLE